MKYIIPFFVLFFLFSACTKKKQKEIAEDDEKTIQAYISSHNLTATRTDSGLYYVIDEVGTGEHPTSTSQVKVAYKGYQTDGTVFDESAATGAVFGLQQVIKGWTEGIPYFKKGGSGLLLIPSALAYGPNGAQGSPGNTVLIFEVKLLDIY